MKYFLKGTGAVLAVTVLLLVTGSFKKKGDCPRSAQVVLSRMNHLYVGVDNPVEIVPTGVPKDSLVVSVNGDSAGITGSGGSYIVRLHKFKKATINVSYKAASGKLVEFCKKEFRPKYVPNPVPYICNVAREGELTVDQVKRELGIFSRMTDFDLDVSMRISSFKMSVNEEGTWKEYAAEGPSFTPEMKTAITFASPGDKILFHDIVVKAPEGRNRKIGGIIITVK